MPIIGYLAAIITIIGGICIFSNATSTSAFVAGHVITGVGFITTCVATAATSSTRFSLIPRNSKATSNEVPGYAEKTMDKMSDGECQRIMIARALAQDTPVILLDEPTAFLDLPNRYELCLLLKKLAQEEKKCVLFSTHDLDIALSLCDSIMLIDNPQMYTLPTPRTRKRLHGTGGSFWSYRSRSAQKFSGNREE